MSGFAKCRECGAVWRLWATGEVPGVDYPSMSLISPKAGPCCDNAAPKAGYERCADPDAN